MAQKNKRRNQTTAKIKSILIEQSLILLCYAGLYSLSAYLSFLTGCLPQQSFYYAIAAFSAAAIVSAAFTAKQAGKNGLFTGLLKTMPCNLCVLAAALILSGFHADFRIVITTIMLVISAAIGGIVGVNIKVKPKPRRKGRGK